MTDRLPPVVRLMLVDDHPLVREGLRARLSAQPGFSVVAEADDADSALSAARRHRPDLVLMDVGMKAHNGIEVTRQLLADDPQARVIMLSMHDHPQTVRAAMAAGARGYLLKDGASEEIIEAIHAVMAGGEHIAEGLAGAQQASTDQGLDSLTPREREVLELIAESLSSRDIGERLGMGVRTVETHRTNLRRKLALSSPAALVRYAVEHRREGRG